MPALLAHDDRLDWQQESIALAVDDYKASIDAIVNNGDANQDDLERALAVLESRLLTVCKMGAIEVDALLDRLYETA